MLFAVKVSAPCEAVNEIGLDLNIKPRGAARNGKMFSPMDPSQPTQPAPRAEVLTASTRSLLPWLVAVAFFMESLDTTILNTAVPVIAKALSVTPLA